MITSGSLRPAYGWCWRTVIVLLVGVCIWGFLGRIEATAPAAVVTDSSGSTCLVPASAVEGVLKNRTVKIDGEPRELVPDVLEPQVISEDKGHPGRGMARRRDGRPDHEPR